MKKNKFYIIILFLFVIVILFVFFIQKETNNKYFKKLSYNDIVSKITYKESFVLCVSSTNCVHCKDYLPKLKKISNKYKTTIYYTDYKDFTNEEYEKFKIDFSFDGGTPTTIFIKDGEEKTTATRIEGNVPMDKIIEKLKKNSFLNK